MTNRKGEAIIRVAIAIVAWAALALQLYILIAGTPGNGLTVVSAIRRFFLFFTVLSNIGVAVVFTASTVNRDAGFTPSALTAITLYIVVVGIVYNLILRSLWHPRGAQLIADNGLHVVVPFLTIFYWLCYVPKGGLKWRQMFSWLIFPAAYLVYALVRGKDEGYYPYPFLDLDKLGTKAVTMNCVVLLFVFIALSALLMLVDRLLARRS